MSRAALAGESLAGEATSRDTATSDPGRPAATFQDAGSAAVAAGVAQRMADGSVVFGGTRTIQRATAISEPPAPAPFPDPPPAPDPVFPSATAPDPEPSADAPAFPDATAPEVPEDPESAPLGFPDTQDARTGTGTGTATGTSTGTGTPPVTDELVRALYAPLSRLLKADLRLERERAGFLINTRH
ncbi:hypothetical protein [Streptomyces sp. NPDC051662]|uniref:hypothetical protein n=1 Tax=Streptomyces sp. NPDC051662 TaxID=3154750 RepID=UPI003417BDEF